MKKNDLDLIVMDIQKIATTRNPLVYISHKIDDTLEAVEEFFEDASIEVDYTVVEKMANELNHNGYVYYGKFLFSLV